MLVEVRHIVIFLLESARVHPRPIMLVPCCACRLFSGNSLFQYHTSHILTIYSIYRKKHLVVKEFIVSHLRSAINKKERKQVSDINPTTIFGIKPLAILKSAAMVDMRSCCWGKTNGFIVSVRNASSSNESGRVPPAEPKVVPSNSARVRFHRCHRRLRGNNEAHVHYANDATFAG